VETYNILAGKPERQRTTWEKQTKMENNIKMGLRINTV
jgi:hypothetical protein